MKIQRETQPFSKTFCTHKKPRFLTKYKLRTSTREQQKAPDAPNSNSETRKLRSKTQISQEFSSQTPCKLAEDNFTKTSHRLYQFNFSHHDPSICVCSDCTCGRHLCQLHAIKPDMTKSTTYKKQFGAKKAIKNNINISTQYGRLMGPNLDLSSVYVKDFQGKSSQIPRHKPEDSLHSKGPLFSLTSYSTNFPGHHGDNQYIKPTDKHTRGDFPLRCRTTYSKSFTGTPCRRRKYDRIPDNLKTGLSWYGNTTYANNFTRPNPQYFAAKYKVEEKAEANPAYNHHQTETSYQSSFVKHDNGQCPAKILIESHSKGSFAKNKARFRQNGEFKSLDPNYRPLSTSKLYIS